jgi:hypothetical protein
MLCNAATPSLSAQSPALSNMRKRRRLGHDDAAFDTDETRIEPKARVHSWVMGLTGKERMRVRRAVIGREEEVDGEDGEDGDGKKRKLSAFTPSKSYQSTAGRKLMVQLLRCHLLRFPNGRYRLLTNYHFGYPNWPRLIILHWLQTQLPRLASSWPLA